MSIINKSVNVVWAYNRYLFFEKCAAHKYNECLGTSRYHWTLSRVCALVYVDITGLKQNVYFGTCRNHWTLSTVCASVHVDITGV